MSHKCSRASSGKENFSVFCKQLKRTGQSAGPVSTASVECKCVNCNKGPCQHKIKRLRTRRERSQVRERGKEQSQPKSCHHHCHRHISKDISFFHSHRPIRRSSTIDAQVPSVAPFAQEPSIITDNRLIGHHGLFNNEVKSIDIERLLSEQRKLEKSRDKIQKMDNTDGVSNSDNDEAVSSQAKAELSAKAMGNTHEKEEINPCSSSQPSDVKPGQRPAQITELMLDSDKNIDSPEHSSVDEVIKKSKKTKQSVKVSDPAHTSTGYKKTLKTKVKGQVRPTPEPNPNNQEPPVYPKQSNCPSPSSPLHSCSTTAGTSDSFHTRPTNQSVSALAATLCSSVYFPYLGQRNLMVESRDVLLKALQKKHGAHLERNLLEVQRCLEFDTEPIPRQVQDQEVVITEERGSWCTDAVTAAVQGQSTRQPCFGAETMAAIKTIERHQYNRESNKYSEEAADAEWAASSVDKSVGLLDDLFSRRSSPHFCMDFEPSQGLSGESEHLFAPSHTKHFEDKLPVSQQLDNNFIRPRKEPARFDSFRNSVTSPPATTTLRERSKRFHHSDSIPPFASYHMHVPHRPSTEPPPFLQEQGSSEAADIFSFAFSPVSPPPQSSLFQPFSPPSAPPSTLGMHQNDLRNYPPSHMLDRDSALTIPSFPSPEHWSFPPMRLY